MKVKRNIRFVEVQCFKTTASRFLDSGFKRKLSRAFNIRELMALLAIFAILVVVFTSHKNDTWRRRQRIACVGQLKQMGLAFRIFAIDHGDKYPMSLATNLGGTAEWKNTPSQLFRHFQILSNELSVPKVILCPSDYGSRLESTNFQNDFETKGNSTTSYFVGLDADETRPQMFLSGDRNIVDPRFGLPNKLATIVNLGTNHNWPNNASWSGNIHRNVGNAGLGDGSVQQLNSARLRKQLMNTGDSTNRLGFP